MGKEKSIFSKDEPRFKFTFYDIKNNKVIHEVGPGILITLPRMGEKVSIRSKPQSEKREIYTVKQIYHGIPQDAEDKKWIAIGLEVSK